jgi:hypothetical protein
MAIFLLKTSIKLIFLVFLEELLHVAMWLKLPKGRRAGCRKFVLPTKSWFFIFFLMVLHDVTFSVKVTI